MSQDTGASVPDRALVASDGAASVSAHTGDGQAQMLAALQKVYVNARFDWLGRDTCAAVRAAIAKAQGDRA